MKNMRTNSIVKPVFTLIGLAMLIVALFLYTHTRGFVETAETINGTVVDLVRSRSSDSNTYRPVVEFKTEDGRTFKFTSTSGSNPPSYSRGEIVEVLYQESSPERAKINSLFSLWGVPVIVGGIGLVFLFIGCAIMLQTKRGRGN